MTGIRPIAISLHRLLSSACLNRDDMDSIIAHKILKFTPISPEKPRFRVDKDREEKILQENKEINDMFTAFLDDFKPETAEKRPSGSQSLDITIGAPSFSSIRRRRSMLFK